MVELKLGLRTVDLPYTVRLYDVTEAMFDEMVDEDTKAELLDGVMIVQSPATLRHDDVSGFIRMLFRGYAEDRDLGRVYGPDSLFHPATCRLFGPDWFFLEAKKTLRRRLSRKLLEGVPDLVGEVLSPSNRDDDLEDKRPAYRQARIRELWFIDPELQEVIVDRRYGKGYRTFTMHDGRLTSLVVPGFWIDVSWLWAEPLPNVMHCLRKILK